MHSASRLCSSIGWEIARFLSLKVMILQTSDSPKPMIEQGMFLSDELNNCGWVKRQWQKSV